MLNLTVKTQAEVDSFKNRILANINKVNLEFEIGYCIKERNQSWGDPELYTYFEMCICFLKGQYHYKTGKNYSYE